MALFVLVGTTRDHIRGAEYKDRQKHWEKLHGRYDFASTVGNSLNIFVADCACIERESLFPWEEEKIEWFIAHQKETEIFHVDDFPATNSTQN